MQMKLDAPQFKLQQIIGARCIQDAAALESLVGHLVHATKECPLGKAYQIARYSAVHVGMAVIVCIP